MHLALCLSLLNLDYHLLQNKILWLQFETQSRGVEVYFKVNLAYAIIPLQSI